MNPKHIIFFDGTCGFCHKSVQFILNQDTKAIFYFSPINSSFGKKSLAQTDQSVDTFYLQSDEALYQKSEAWLKTLFLLGGFWKLISIALSKTPEHILDNGYDFIAKHRKSIFGTKDNCDLLSKDQKERFILD